MFRASSAPSSLFPPDLLLIVLQKWSEYFLIVSPSTSRQLSVPQGLAISQSFQLSAPYLGTREDSVISAFSTLGTREDLAVSASGTLETALQNDSASRVNTLVPMIGTGTLTTLVVLNTGT